MKAGSQNGNPKLILEGIYKFDAKFSSGYYDKKNAIWEENMWFPYN